MFLWLTCYLNLTFRLSSHYERTSMKSALSLLSLSFLAIKGCSALFPGLLLSCLSTVEVPSHGQTSETVSKTMSLLQSVFLRYFVTMDELTDKHGWESPEAAQAPTCVPWSLHLSPGKATSVWSQESRSF